MYHVQLEELPRGLAKSEPHATATTPRPRGFFGKRGRAVQPQMAAGHRPKTMVYARSGKVEGHRIASAELGFFYLASESGSDDRQEKPN